MSSIQLSRRAAGALAILVIGVLAIAGGLLIAKANVDNTWLEVEAKTTELEALRRRMQMATQPSGPVEDVDPFLEGANYALAANALQQRVVGLIESIGGKLVTFSIDPPDVADEESGRRVVVQAVSELNNDGLQELIYRLEAERPLVFLDTLTVTRLAARAGGDEAEAEKDARLGVDLRISGFFRRAAR